MNNNIIGCKWSDLTLKQQEELLQSKNCIDGITGNNSKGGECIVDFESGISIAGNLAIGDYEDIVEIDNNSILYCSSN